MQRTSFTPVTRPREVQQLAGLMALLAFLLYQFTLDPATYNRGDNYWFVPTAQSLLRSGTIDLRSNYSEEIHDTAAWNWMSIDTPRGRVNYFGFGTSVIILPVVALGNQIYADLPVAERDDSIAALAARILAASSVGMMLVTVAALGGSLAQATLLAGILALATPHVSIHAGGLWSHNAVLLCYLIAVCLLARSTPQPWIAVVPLAYAFYCRPSASLPLALTWGGMLVFRDWPSARRYAATGAALLGLMLWHWHSTMGLWLPPYYAGQNYEAASRSHPDSLISEAMLGHLFSPNRGLFIFLPSAAISAIGIWRSWTHPSAQAPLFRLLTIWLAAHLALISSYPHWWLGHSFGPRAWAEMYGVVVILMLPALQLELRRRFALVLRAGLVALTICGGLLANWRGAFCSGAITWNVTPANVDEHPGRVWDWDDLQIFRGHCGP